MDTINQAAEPEAATPKTRRRIVLGKSIIRQAAFALQIMILLVISAGGVSLWFSRAIEDSVRQMQEASKQALWVSSLQIRWLTITSTLDALSVTRSMPNTTQDLDQQILEMETELSALAKAKIGLSAKKISENAQIVSSMQQSEKELTQLIENLIPLVEKGRWGTAMQLRQSSIAAIQTRLINDMGKLNTNMQSEMVGLTVKITQLQDAALFLSITIVGLGIFFSIYAIWFTRRMIQTPLHKLIADMEMVSAAVSSRDLKPVVALERHDEIGELSKALVKLMRWLQESYGNLEDQVAQRTARLELRTKQMEISAQVARDIVNTRNPETLLYKAVNTIRDRFNLYHTGIFLVDKRQEYAVLRSATGQAGREMLERNHRLKIGQSGLVGYAVQTGEARIASDVGQDSVHYKNPSLPETRSEAALPLTVSGEVIGVLDVQSQKEGAFDEETVAVLQIVADQLAVAIQNARLFEESQENLRELETAYQQANQQAWERLAENTNLVGYEFDGYKLRPIYTFDRSGETGLAAKDGSEAVQIPLKVRGYEVGSIDVWPEEGQLSTKDSHLLSNISDRLSQTLESARLYDETRRKAERERITGEIVTKIRSTNDPQAIFQTAVQELRKVLAGPPSSREDGKNLSRQPDGYGESGVEQPSAHMNGEQ